MALCNNLTLPFIISTVILPQFINLSDKDGNYMSIDSTNSLVFDKKEPDADCTFEVITYSSGVAFKGANGLFIIQYYTGWFRCDVDYKESSGFDAIHAKGNEFYFHSKLTEPRYITNRRSPKYDGLAASSYAGSDCLFTVSEPIISKEIHDVVYDIPKASLLDVPPTIALNTTIRNDSKSSNIQQTLSYSYERSKVGTWNNTAGVGVGASTSFSAGVPFIGSAKVQVSVTASYSHQWGGSEGTVVTVSDATQITVPGGKKGEVAVLVKKKKLDVSFTYKETIIYKDGKKKTNDKNGVYSNVESYMVDVQAGDWEDI